MWNTDGFFLNWHYQSDVGRVPYIWLLLIGSFRYVYGSEVASLRTSDDEIVSEGLSLSRFGY